MVRRGALAVVLAPFALGACAPFPSTHPFLGAAPDAELPRLRVGDVVRVHRASHGAMVLEARVDSATFDSLAVRIHAPGLRDASGMVVGSRAGDSARVMLAWSDIVAVSMPLSDVRRRHVPSAEVRTTIDSAVIRSRATRGASLAAGCVAASMAVTVGLRAGVAGGLTLGAGCPLLVYATVPAAEQVVPDSSRVTRGDRWVRLEAPREQLLMEGSATAPRVQAGDWVGVARASEGVAFLRGRIETVDGVGLTMRIPDPGPHDTAGLAVTRSAADLVTVVVPWSDVTRVAMPRDIAIRRGIPHDEGPTPVSTIAWRKAVVPAAIAGVACGVGVTAWFASRNESAAILAPLYGGAASAVCAATVMAIGGSASLGAGWAEGLPNPGRWVVIPDARAQLLRVASP